MKESQLTFFSSALASSREANAVIQFDPCEHRTPPRRRLPSLLHILPGRRRSVVLFRRSAGSVFSTPTNDVGPVAGKANWRQARVDGSTGHLKEQRMPLVGLSTLRLGERGTTLREGSDWFRCAYIARLHPMRRLRRTRVRSHKGQVQSFAGLACPFASPQSASPSLDKSRTAVAHDMSRITWANQSSIRKTVKLIRIP